MCISRSLHLKFKWRWRRLTGLVFHKIKCSNIYQTSLHLFRLGSNDDINYYLLIAKTMWKIRHYVENYDEITIRINSNEQFYHRFWNILNFDENGLIFSYGNSDPIISNQIKCVFSSIKNVLHWLKVKATHSTFYMWL